MNWSTIETRWNDYKGHAKQQWAKLTDDQINATGGKREFLSMRVQETYAVTKEDADRQISDWQSKQVEKQAPAAKS
jgi:uncharacterized protein YjbJ (UPF0337 family)